MIDSFRQRIGAAWRTKLILGGILALAFWTAYALLERRTGTEVVLMPLTRYDRSLPLWPFAAWVYVSQFITAPFLLWLAPTRRAVRILCSGIGLMAAVSFLLYFFSPTGVVRPESFVDRNLAYDLVLLLDLPRNACPSLHAGFAVFLTACSVQLTKGISGRALWLVCGLVWTIAVLLSTLLIRQHVLMDLLAGAMLGLFSYWTIHGRLSFEMNTHEKTQRSRASVFPLNPLEDVEP